MKAWQIQFLCCISLGLFLFSGCGAFQRMTLQKTEVRLLKAGETKTWAGQTDESVLFRLFATFFKQEMSGLLLVKKVNDTQTHTVITSETGIKAMDFSFNPKESGIFDLHYLLPEADKKWIRKKMAQDLSFFAEGGFYAKQAKFYQSRKSGQKVIRVNTGFGKTFFYFLPDERLQRTAQFGFFGKKKEMTIASYRNGLPEEVVLRHRPGKIFLELKMLRP